MAAAESTANKGSVACQAIAKARPDNRAHNHAGSYSRAVAYARLCTVAAPSSLSRGSFLMSSSPEKGKIFFTCVASFLYSITTMENTAISVIGCKQLA
eukprot:20856-Heterococcus_DN1.PRE.1